MATSKDPVVSTACYRPVAARDKTPRLPLPSATRSSGPLKSPLRRRLSRYVLKAKCQVLLSVCSRKSLSRKFRGPNISEAFSIVGLALAVTIIAVLTGGSLFAICMYLAVLATALVTL